MKTADQTPPFYKVIKSRGGSGQNAQWVWQVFATGKPLALVKGTTAGPERRAHEMAEAAIERLTAKAAAHAANNQ